jgi:5-formaminoimidazole-4-carboxamide-1-beta-D-ribofuranosyl 5'-monophosphate synthetase
LRSEQSIICSEESLESFNNDKKIDNDLTTKKVGPIKVIDFEKNKLDEKKRRKMMEKKGLKNMKVHFFN